MIHIIKSTWRNTAINKKFNIILTSVIATNVIFGVILTTIFTSINLKNNSINYMNTTLNSLAQRFDDNLRSVENISQDILYDEKIYSILSHESLDTISYYDNQSIIKDRLKNIVSSNQQIKSVGVISNSNKLYAHDVDNTLNKYYRLYYNDILSQLKDHDQTPLWFFKDGYIYLFRSINNIDTLEQIGFIMIVLYDNFSQSLYETSKINKAYTLAIFSANNELCYISNRNYNIKLFNNTFFDHIHKNNGILTKNTTKELICYSTLSTNKWKIVMVSSLKLLSADVGTLQKMFLLFGILSGSIIFVFVHAFSKHLLIPINLIIASIGHFRENNKFDYIDLNRNDEIGSLCETFNEMISHMDYLTQTVYTKNLVAKNSQIKALQSQIDPHFIFNTLDTINWTARLNGDDQAGNMIAALSSILRATSGKMQPQISLKKELVYIDNYILLIKARFDDTLKILKQISPETLEMEIPSLTIQPLLENALKHGIEKSTRKGVIFIKSYITEENFIVEVIDNGVGIKPEDVERINNDLKLKIGELDSKDFDTQIGLLNTNQRIKLYYGDEYGITINSRLNHYTKITCVLPKKLMSFQIQ